MKKINKKHKKGTNSKKLSKKLQDQKEVLEKLLTEIEKDHASNLKNK